MSVMSIAKMKNNYEAALDYLYSFVDYSLTRQLRYSEEKFNLDRIRKLMGILGNPQSKYPVVHIAGTKGKGSTAVFIASVLQTAGYKVGLYTSPHLHDYTERIQVNRVPISHDDLISNVEYIRNILNEVPEITTFEITTAIAFRHFFEEKIDIAVVEVGLGGRLDATNIVDPLISVITSLSYDHMNILGDTIEKIAAEKGGIIKANHPVVVAPQVFTETYPVLEEIAVQHHSQFVRVDRIYESKIIDHSLNGQKFSITDIENQNDTVELAIKLLGSHQIDNAVTAYCALNLLREKNIKISQKDIIHGFASAYWPCRFEIVSSSPMIIIDSAHNADSAEKLINTVKDYLGGYKITLIFGASEDKDINGMFNFLLPISDVIIMTKSTHPRAMGLPELKEAALHRNREAYTFETIEEALSKAYEVDENNVILITGSIFIAAAAKEIISLKDQDK